MQTLILAHVYTVRYRLPESMRTRSWETGIFSIIEDMAFGIHIDDKQRIKKESGALYKSVFSQCEIEDTMKRWSGLEGMYLIGNTPQSMPRFGISFETEAQQATFFNDVEPDVELNLH